MPSFFSVFVRITCQLVNLLIGIARTLFFNNFLRQKKYIRHRIDEL
jgi:hypothetical protein